MRIAIIMTAGLALGGAGLAAGCTGHRPPVATAAATAPASAAPPAAPAEGPVTEAECRALIDHVIDLAAKADPSTAPADAAARDKVRATMERELLGACMEDVSRPELSCGLAATTEAALRGCDA
ncbi:MAG TPA: hypothetical protein VFG83_03590 [Kofleriaceae bacterium]|nr:hypothetical protein [Kofleriaceae bacterium]